MRVLPIVLLLLCVSSAAVAEDAVAPEDTATLWAALRAGGHVALVRHGATAGGAGDPPGFRLDDCATQRNLTDKGRADGFITLIGRAAAACRADHRANIWRFEWRRAC